MKKICFITGELSRGGAERMVANLANSFSNRQDFKVTIILMTNTIDYPINDNLSVVCLKQYKNKLNKIYELRKKIKEVDPDVIISFLDNICMMTILATTFTKFRNRVITTIRNNPNYGKHSLEFQFYFLKKSKKCIFQNKGERNCFPKLKDEKSVIIPNYYNSKFENENRIYNNRVKKIISVGRLEEQKNYKLLIDSIGKIEDNTIKLDIVGKGTLKEELLDYIKSKKMEDRISIIDWSKNVKELLDQADLFVMSSKYEGMPNALMEAMVSGIPCISTNCDFGPNELIQDRINGLLVKNEDPNDLVNNINYAVNNYENMIELAKNAVVFMKKNYSEQVIINLWTSTILSF